MKTKINKIYPRSKRSQMKIQQMMFMLIAITLFFILIGLFVLVFKMTDLKNTATNINEENAILLVEKLANSPEFSCGEAFQAKVNCVDADKLMVLKDNTKYEDFWQVAGIEVIKIYPKSNEETECTDRTYPDCNKITIFQKDINKISKSSFVSLCRKEKDAETERIYDKCDIAKLLVSYEVKT